MGKHTRPRARLTGLWTRHVEMVDVRTRQAHLLSDAAVAAGRRGGGHYVALCGAEILPASLTTPRGYCRSCSTSTAIGPRR